MRSPFCRLTAWLSVGNATWCKAVVLVLAYTAAPADRAWANYTPLTPVPSPRVVGSAEPYSGGGYDIGRLLDGSSKTEYSSNGKGTNTFVRMEFSEPVRLGAIRHTDRNDPATIAGSELVFKDAEGHVTATLPVRHSGEPGGETFAVFPAPVTAREVTWRVTELGPRHLGTVGGAELTFFAIGKPEALPTQDRLELHSVPWLEKNSSSGLQPLKISISHFYVEPAEARLQVTGLDPMAVQLKSGVNALEVKLAEVELETRTVTSLQVGEQVVARSESMRKPVRPLTVYILPHSHTDIGYTEIQTRIEKKQVQNLIDGIAYARRTAEYPEGARFVWNVEVLWAADLYLHRLSEPQQADFMDAVKKGQVVLNGMYLNELTGLCRPEELIQLFRFATQLGHTTGVPIEAAMISDVPGYTWGTVTAMRQAGIKYFSTAPNYFDRIGTIMREWENKPFWWVGPDAQEKILVWIPFWGYAMSHIYPQMTPKLVEDFYAGLEKRAYPYDIAYVRWSGHGDNAVPDPSICEFVRDWNAKYLWPHFIISGTSQAFAALEKRYGPQLPKVRGDWTPYWEDGAGSSASETALNRQSSDRLVQAEALFAMRDPNGYDAGSFGEAWKPVLLYSEHTWGADCSISQPESQKTREQWEIKKGYALSAVQQSRALFAKALQSGSDTSDTTGKSFDVINTTSWLRTEVVLLSKRNAPSGDVVLDEKGTPMLSQRLTDDQLAFVAQDVPPFSTRRFTVLEGTMRPAAKASAQGAVLDDGLIHVRLDEKTGGIVELTTKGLDGNLVDTSGGEALNDYLYLPGDDLKDRKRNEPVTIKVGETGPVIASLIVESAAPGCKKLRREVRIVAGLGYIELVDLVDKARLPAPNFHAKEGKESVNFAFPFQVPDGEIWLDLPLGMMRPELDQMPSACKNWFTVGRWADVSNAERGVTWVTLDAPLVELGGITANLLNSQTNPDAWRKHVGRTQKIYSWAMNNHWGTNYRAYQEGLTTFRFVLRPHRKPDLAEASRFAIGFSQPLLAVPARSPFKAGPPLLKVEPADVLVTALKPADHGNGLIVRLFNASTESRISSVRWGERRPKAVYLSDTTEKPGKPLTGAITLPSQGLVTLRAEME